MKTTEFRSPLGIRVVEGKHGWVAADNDLLSRVEQDLLVGFEMGFACATVDPWAPRGAYFGDRDILMFEEWCP